MQVLNESIIYENELPQLRSRHSLFPFCSQLNDGTILASHAIGEAFESVDMTSYLSRSLDCGFTFSKPEQMFHLQTNSIYSDTCKITKLPDGRLVALGYAYNRSDPEKPIGNPQTGGLLDDVVFISYSQDEGLSWSSWDILDTSWGNHAEASAPLTVLQSGSWVTPITGFKTWEGKTIGRNCGRLLRSDDEGRTWSDQTICMCFDDQNISCYEQRLCQLDSGRIICIGWNEHLINGTLYPNHFTISDDDGRTFSDPVSTGIYGQASSVCAVGGEQLLALHAVRKDCNRPGIYAFRVDLSKGKWDMVDELLIWEPDHPVVADNRMARIFAYLKFGQPGAIRLHDDSCLISYWREKNCQYITSVIRLIL